MIKFYNKQKSAAAFTLIEILIYISVLVIIIAAIYSLLLWSVNSYTKAKAIRETLNNGGRAAELITYEIREAKSILSAGSGALSLERADGVVIDFYICGVALDALCFKRGSEDPAFLTSDKVEITTLSFMQIATSSIQVRFTINYKNPANRPEYQAIFAATSTVSLRPH